MISKNILKFEVLIKNYSYTELIKLRAEIKYLTSLVDKQFNLELDEAKKIVFGEELTTLKINIEVVTMALSYFIRNCVRQTEFGDLSLN